MRRTSRARIAGLGLVATIVAFAVLRVVERSGGTLLPVPPIAWLAELLIAAVVGALA